MTTEQKIIRTKVGLLELAKQLKNVQQACAIMGYSRDSFYRFRDLYETGGEEALKEVSRREPNLRNRIAARSRSASSRSPWNSPPGASCASRTRSRKEGVRISPTGVRGVWVRHDLETMESACWPSRRCPRARGAS